MAEQLAVEGTLLVADDDRHTGRLEFTPESVGRQQAEHRGIVATRMLGNGEVADHALKASRFQRIDHMQDGRQVFCCGGREVLHGLPRTSGANRTLSGGKRELHVLNLRLVRRWEQIAVSSGAHNASAVSMIRFDPTSAAKPEPQRP